MMANVDLDESTNDDVGTIGEWQFGLWCSQADIVPNRVGTDRRGSDFLIEFDGPTSEWRLEQITSKVQVKSSTAGAACVSIKLDNFVRMASDLHPWFVVALAFDAKKHVRSAHVVHVDETLVRRVYQRVIAVPPGEPLHKRMLKISWDEDERLPEPTARAMSERIKSHIGESMWDYVARKRAWHEALDISRYVSGTCTITASSPREAMEMLSDLAIGVIDRVPIESVRVAGIVALTLTDGEGYFWVEDRPSLTTTVVTVEAGGQLATLRCKTFHSKQAFPQLPDEFGKFRFESTLLSIVASDVNQVLHWHLAPPLGRYRMADLGSAARAVMLLAQPDARITFEILGHRVSVRAAPGALPTAWAPGASRFAAACIDASWIVGHLGLDVDMEIDPRILESQAKRLRMLRGVLDPRSSIPEVRVLVTDASADGRNAALVVCPGALFEDIIVVACVGLVGKTEQLDATWTIVIRQPQVRFIGSRCVRREDWQTSIGLDLIADGVSRFDADGLAVITIDPPTSR